MVAKSPKPKVRRQPSLIEPKEAAKALAAAEASGASPVTKLAYRLLALTVVRPAIVRDVRWEEFEGIDWTGDFIGPTLPVWRVPAGLMKLLLDRKDEEAYDHLMTDKDRQMFRWVRYFNPFDLYTKGDAPPNVEALKPYYQELIAEFFPEKLKW